MSTRHPLKIILHLQAVRRIISHNHEQPDDFFVFGFTTILSKECRIHNTFFNFRIAFTRLASIWHLAFRIWIMSNLTTVIALRGTRKENLPFSLFFMISYVHITKKDVFYRCSYIYGLERLIRLSCDTLSLLFTTFHTVAKADVS